MKVLITGARGFVGRNLLAHLKERPDVEVRTFTRDDAPSELDSLVRDVDCVFHLAGVNRPSDPMEFQFGNVDLTSSICTAIINSGQKPTIVYASSTQASLPNPYGRSKLAAENALKQLAEQGCAVHIYRLPNVFGKWARPNYNSVVATFCHNISRNLPIRVDDPDALVKLVYIDDVIGAFVDVLDDRRGPDDARVEPEYSTSVGELAAHLTAFRVGRETLVTDRVGAGFLRALYSTYISYLAPAEFSYQLPKHGDARGVFVEMLKTRDSGQFSFFTAHPGVTRGGHYHHSKTEKFLVIRGVARFRFKNIDSGECHELTTTGERPEVVETAPGWSHDITNVGNEEMIVMLWANEVFDPARPDTYPFQVVE